MNPKTFVTKIGRNSLQWFFYRASSYASAVLGLPVVIMPVSPSVLCDKTEQCTADILTPQERAIALGCWHQQRLADDVLFSLKFALKVTQPFEKRRPTDFHLLRLNRKSSIMTNRKSTMGFPTSYTLSQKSSHL